MINNSYETPPYTIPSLTVKLLEISAGFHEQTQLPTASIPKRFFGHLFSKIINITLLPITLIIDGLANLIFKPIIFLAESVICYSKGIFNPAGARTRFRNYHLQERPSQKAINSEIIKILQSIVKELEGKIEDSNTQISSRDDAIQELKEEFQNSLKQISGDLNYANEQIITRENIIRLLENPKTKKLLEKQKTKDLDDARAQIIAHEDTIQLLEFELQKFDDIIAKIHRDNYRDIRSIAFASKRKEKELTNNAMKLYYENQEKTFDDLLRKRNIPIEENDCNTITGQMLDLIYDLQETIYIQQLEISNQNKWLNVYQCEIETTTTICEKQKKRIQNQRLESISLQKILTPQKPHEPKSSEKKYNSRSYLEINSSPYKSPSKTSARRSPSKVISNSDQSLRIPSIGEATPVNRELKF